MNTTAASPISNRRATSKFPWWDAAQKAQRLQGAERDRFWRDFGAPPNVRARKREARLWIDLLSVLGSDPCRSERRPGDGWFTFAEKRSIWYRAHDELRASDLELFRAVDRVKWDNSVLNEGIGLKEWHVRVARRGRVIKRLRAAVREEVPGPLPFTWQQISAVLRCPSARVARSRYHSTRR